MSIKPFSKFVESLSEAVWLDRLNNRVEVIDDNRFSAEYNLSVPSDQIIGAVAFGSVSVPRTLFVDKNYAHDMHLGKTKYVARIQNSLTNYSGGYVENATLAKFDLEKGTMWLAEEDSDDGSINWGRGFKFKRMLLNKEVAERLAWIK